MVARATVPIMRCIGAVSTWLVLASVHEISDGDGRPSRDLHSDAAMVVFLSPLDLSSLWPLQTQPWKPYYRRDQTSAGLFNRGLSFRSSQGGKQSVKLGFMLCWPLSSLVETTPMAAPSALMIGDPDIPLGIRF